MCFKYLLLFSVLLNTFVCKVKHKKQNKLYLMGEKRMGLNNIKWYINIKKQPTVVDCFL